MSNNNRSYLDASNAACFGKHACMTAVSLKRQLPSAQHILNQLFGSNDRKGMLLADDVGLGKTTIGAIVAWVAAGEGDGRSVRILAPNVVVAQRWEEELRRVLPAMLEIAGPELNISERNIRAGAVKLHQSHIHVTTQTRAVARGRLTGNLLIVDEAHRSKSDNSDFRLAIKDAIKAGTKVLMLTATPMSIKTSELASLLDLLAGKQVSAAVTDLGKQIQLLYQATDVRDDATTLTDLCGAADRATKQMATCVLRHSVNDLKSIEQLAFGRGREPWHIKVPPASTAELELLVRMDRLNRLAHPHATRSNDPQFHVARTPVQHALKEAVALLKTTTLAKHAAVHTKSIKKLLLLKTPHPKMKAVAQAISTKIGEGEKVVVFCYHHLVAADMTLTLASHIQPCPTSRFSPSAWRAVWTELVEHASEKMAEVKGGDGLRRAFIEWICSKSFRDQIGSWLAPDDALTVSTLETSYPPGENKQSIAEAMVDLLKKVLNPKSKSTFGIFSLRAGSMERIKPLPFGANQATRVIGACESETAKGSQLQHAHLFLQEQRPDLLLELFNSPFGPDVLVLTDKYSEGIDLHRRCRLLVHYELNASPMRTIQREGRVRRIGGWASKNDKPVEYAMPYFAGTRDERVVRIMEDRIQNFGLLLGGMPPCEESEVGYDIEERAQRVLSQARDKLSKYNARLNLKQRA